MRASKKYCSLSCIDSIRMRSSGTAPSQLCGGLKSGHPRHRHVENRQVDVVGQGAFDRLSAIADLSYHLEVRVSVQHQPQATSDDRVVVG